MFLCHLFGPLTGNRTKPLETSRFLVRPFVAPRPASSRGPAPSIRQALVQRSCGSSISLPGPWPASTSTTTGFWRCWHNSPSHTSRISSSMRRKAGRQPWPKAEHPPGFRNYSREGFAAFSFFAVYQISRVESMLAVVALVSASAIATDFGMTGYCCL